MPATLADIQRKYGESVYPLYKDQMHEPYMENDNGIGYKGVVMYDELEDKVQCHLCGKWYEFLGSHIKDAHQTTANEYREAAGINITTPLCSVKYSEKRRAVALENKVRPPRSSYRNKRTHKTTMQYKNKHGLCDAQIAARMIIVSEMIEKPMNEITTSDVRNCDQALMSSLARKYGNYQLAAKALGITSPGRGAAWLKRVKYDDAILIAKLRDFVIKNERIPVSSKNNTDFGHGKSLPSTPVFARVFGSMRRAKMMAGLDQLLAEVKSE